jgi:predicted secreted protein
MAISLINIGYAANDGTVDDLREAFVKVNANFEDLDLRNTEQTRATNLGTEGEGLYAKIVNYELQFKKLVAGNDITLSSTATGITIDAYGGLKTLTVNANTGAVELEEVASLNIVGGTDITTRIVGDTLTIDYNGLSELVGDTSPQLGGNLDAQSFNLLNVGNIDAAQVTGGFVGNLTGLVYGIDIRGFNEYFNNYWDFGVIADNFTNIIQWIAADANFDFGTFTNPDLRSIDGGSL